MLLFKAPRSQRMEILPDPPSEELDFDLVAVTHRLTGSFRLDGSETARRSL